MKATVTIQLVTDIEIEAEGEEIHEREFVAGEGFADDVSVEWDNADIQRQTEAYVKEHFGVNAEYQIIQVQ